MESNYNEKTAYEIGVHLALENTGLLEKTAAGGDSLRRLLNSLRRLRGGAGRGAAVRPRAFQSRPADPRMAIYGGQSAPQITYQGRRIPGDIPGSSYAGASLPVRSYRHQI